MSAMRSKVKGEHSRSRTRNAENTDFEVDVGNMEATLKKSSRDAMIGNVSTSAKTETPGADKPETKDTQSKIRKRDAVEAELEIDVDAPEPPSKKALRKSKKAKQSPSSKSATATEGYSQNPAKQDDTRDSTKRSEHGIWIGNLSFGTTKDDLVKFLTADSRNGINSHQISRVHLPQGPAKFGKPQNKGFAYIDFSDQECMERALEFSESVLGGRRVLIKNAKNFEGRPEQKNEKDGKSNQPPSRRIFVGNLDFATTVEDLEEHFGILGTITHTQMATFEDSGKCKGYAWIEFEQLSSAEKAMRGWVEADDSTKDLLSKPKSGSGRIWVNKIQGRKLRMEYAEDKAVRYEKRFGKHGRKTVAEEESTDELATVKVEGEEKRAQRANDQRKTKRANLQGKYSEETVQMLTGAIVESKGQRTVFE